MTDPRILNVPARVIDFAQGGEEYIAWQRHGRSPDPTRLSRELDDEAVAFWRAVDNSRRIRAGRGHYYRILVDQRVIDHLRYWSETLETSSEDNAACGDTDARNDFRAARTMLDRLP